MGYFPFSCKLGCKHIIHINVQCTYVMRVLCTRLAAISRVKVAWKQKEILKRSWKRERKKRSNEITILNEARHSTTLLLFVFQTSVISRLRYSFTRWWREFVRRVRMPSRQHKSNCTNCLVKNTIQRNTICTKFLNHTRAYPSCVGVARRDLLHSTLISKCTRVRVRERSRSVRLFRVFFLTRLMRVNFTLES